MSETGWPYVQHRGGPAGFLKVLDERTLAFADFRGNRQYITVGNTSADSRVALILIDYPRRRRLKIYATMESHALAGNPGLAAQIALPDYRGIPERAFVLHLQAFDWNCPQHMTPRFTQAEVTDAAAPLIMRIEELETENSALRAAAATGGRTT